MGLNGHGKTTLIRAITHMTEWQSGSIKFCGNEIGGTRSFGAGRRTAKLVKMGISVAPQGDAIFPGLTVKQHLNVVLQKKHGKKKNKELIKFLKFFLL